MYTHRESNEKYLLWCGPVWVVSFFGKAIQHEACVHSSQLTAAIFKQTKSPQVSIHIFHEKLGRHKLCKNENKGLFLDDELLCYLRHDETIKCNVAVFCWCLSTEAEPCVDNKVK